VDEQRFGLAVEDLGGQLDLIVHRGDGLAAGTEGRAFGVARFGSGPNGPNKSAQGNARIVRHKSQL
jgi:hypothetical protein